MRISIIVLLLIGSCAWIGWREQVATHQAADFCRATVAGENVQDLLRRAHAAGALKLKGSDAYYLKVSSNPETYPVMFVAWALSRHICFVEIINGKVSHAETGHLD